MNSSDGKPTPGLRSLFGFLFSPEATATAQEEYQRALAKAARDLETINRSGPASNEKKESEPKCWIN